jgi:hypothetical protein
MTETERADARSGAGIARHSCKRAGLPSLVALLVLVAVSSAQASPAPLPRPQGFGLEAAPAGSCIDAALVLPTVKHAYMVHPGRRPFERIRTSSGRYKQPALLSNIQRSCRMLIRLERAMKPCCALSAARYRRSSAADGGRSLMPVGALPATRRATPGSIAWMTFMVSQSGCTGTLAIASGPRSLMKSRIWRQKRS